ncbi:hypothetical protein BaRGS_00036316 [Batillaria attramentaria]|uniref:Long-chain-fatty-acid--CoA ligase n=1 Tax=Batillaria attramentaria TaxID=370345 RepID=A0ABD0JDG6_9CAEN
MPSRIQQFLRDNAHVLGASALTLAGAAAASAYFSSKPEPLTPPLDLNNQSIVVNEKEDIRASGYLSANANLMTYLYDDAKTTYEAFLRGLRVSNNGRCLGRRTGPNRSYKWLTYQEVLEKAQWFGSALIACGMKPGNSTFLGIYSANCVEWAVADLGCQMFSMVPVPLYDTLGLAACKYIINQTELCTLVCDDVSKTIKLLKEASEMKSLKRIVLIRDSVPDDLKQVAAQHNLEVLTYNEVEEIGKKNAEEPKPPKPEDLATLCYTSGTTGDPKGVMLTHANFLICLSAVYFHARGVFSLEPSDTHLSYLPLAHMFERGMHIMLYMHGAQIGYFSGDIRKLTEDLMELRPSLFPTVPRLLNRIYDKVQAGVRGSWLKSLLLKGIIRNNSIWDRLVFGRIQKMLGGRVRYIVTGSAPLSASVLDFTRCAFGCLVMEGYGQTESSAGITFNVPGETEAGNVGTPLACNYVKLVDVPEMDYYAKDGRGEVCAQGGNVMKGYYRNPEKTAEALDDEGWLHTGDIGLWLPSGALKIIDRKKNIFKLAQGEYVAVEKVENVYQKSKFVAQCFVEGDSFKPCLMAVVVPDEEVVRPFAESNGLPTDMEAKEIILKDMLAEGKANDLKGFEQAKDIHLHPDLFSVEDGLLTPTMKNKRPALRKVFKDTVDALYRKHNL